LNNELFGLRIFACPINSMMLQCMKDLAISNCKHIRAQSAALTPRISFEARPDRKRRRGPVRPRIQSDPGTE
jgi:hypothetical protein